MAGEMITRRLKAEILLGGVNIERSALEGEFKEEIHRVFEWDPLWHERGRYPSELILPDGAVLPIRKNAGAPYCLAVEEDKLLLKKDGDPLFEVEYIKRPAFYDRQTSDGMPMWRIAEFSAERAKVGITYDTQCLFWETHEQCRYCNFVPTRRTHEEMLAVPTPLQHAEAVAAAYQEGARNLCVTGGVLPEREEFLRCNRIGRAIRKITGEEKIPGHVNLVAPTDLREIDRLHETGFESVCMSIEIWDENLFKGICPGKARWVGRENWIRALEYAVGLFGPGKVMSVFVAGLEPKQSLMEGAEYLASRGVLPVPTPWFPSPGSAYEGHRTPTVEWHLDLGDRLRELWVRYDFTREIARTGRNYV
ncbi:MAG: nitrogen fixation protein NifB [Deltaproteobacteria bacterium]|nr:nitrogen fixation protein NifB [Deltaproteobacteria bacterium]